MVFKYCNRKRSICRGILQRPVVVVESSVVKANYEVLAGKIVVNSSLLKDFVGKPVLVRVYSLSKEMIKNGIN